MSHAVCIGKKKRAGDTLCRKRVTAQGRVMCRFDLGGRFNLGASYPLNPWKPPGSSSMVAALCLLVTAGFWGRCR